MKGSEKNLKEKTVQICIRISEKEKKKLQRNAKKSGLSLSNYLRKTGLKQKIYPIPDKEFYQIYLQICQLKNDIFKLDIDKIEECLDIIEHNFLVIYNSESNGDDEDGNNENMGS